MTAENLTKRIVFLMKREKCKQSQIDAVIEKLRLNPNDFSLVNHVYKRGEEYYTLPNLAYGFSDENTAKLAEIILKLNPNMTEENLFKALPMILLLIGCNEDEYCFNPK